MIIEDCTINRKFSELDVGTCFVMYSNYYMKLNIRLYDEYSNQNASLSNYAVNLKTGFAEVVNDDERVRVLDAKMIVG